MKTSIAALKHADWDQLESDVVTRIRLLKTAVEGMEAGPLNDKIAQGGRAASQIGAFAPGK